MNILTLGGTMKCRETISFIGGSVLRAAPPVFLVAQTQRGRSLPARDADALVIAAGRNVDTAPDIILRIEEATRVAVGAGPAEPGSLRDTS